MTIDYDFYKNPPAEGDTSEKYHVRAVPHQTVGLRALAHAISRRSTVSMADTLGTMSALVETMIDSLAMGHTVHLDGLGFFGLSVGGTVVRDAKGKLRLKDGCVDGLHFRPEKGLLQAFDRCSLTRTTLLGRHSAPLDEAALRERLQQAFGQQKRFTMRQFMSATGLTRSTATRRLRQLLKDGVVVNEGSPRTPIYALTDIPTQPSTHEATDRL